MLLGSVQKQHSWLAGLRDGHVNVFALVAMYYGDSVMHGPIVCNGLLCDLQSTDILLTRDHLQEQTFLFDAMA